MKWKADITMQEQHDHKTVNVLIQIRNEHGEQLYTYTTTTHDAYLCFHRGWYWRSNMIASYCRQAAQHFNVSLRLTHPITNITRCTAIIHPSIFETHRFDQGLKSI